MAAFRLGALRDLFGKSDESKRRKAEEARPKLEVLQEAARVAREAAARQPRLGTKNRRKT